MRPVGPVGALLCALVLGGCASPAQRAPDGPSPDDGAAPADPEAGPSADPDSATDEGIGTDEGAGTDGDGARAGRLGMLGDAVRFVDEAQGTASDRFNAFMLDLDGFFAGDVETDESNTSFVRLRVDAVSPAVGRFELDPSVKLRVVLPRTEERVRFLLTTEDELGVAGEGVDEGVELTDASGGESVSFALRFVRGLRTRGDTSVDLGARQRDGRLQIYTRVRLELEERFGDRWEARAANRWYYHYVSGYENQLRLDLSRPLDRGGRRFFRSTTTFDWERERKGASIGQTFGAYAELSPRTALAAELLGRYDTSVLPGASDRYRGAEARLRLRRNVWRPWFFYELWPSVSWPAETDYRRVWHGLARIEVTIGGRYREFPEERVPTPPPTAPGAPADPDDAPGNGPADGAGQDGAGGENP